VKRVVGKTERESEVGRCSLRRRICFCLGRTFSGVLFCRKEVYLLDTLWAYTALRGSTCGRRKIIVKKHRQEAREKKKQSFLRKSQ
jgi:hypothetical protein